MPALMAYCDVCLASVPVGREAVLEFDVRCAACRDGTLVLRWNPEAPPPRPQLPPPPPPPPPAPLPPRPTVALRADGALPGVVAVLPSHAEETRADADDTRADEETLDPFEEAAAKLDASVTVAMKRARRSAAAALGQPSPSEIGRQLALEQDPERGDRPTTVVRIAGTPPEAPPLPSLDGGDTNKLRLLAHEVPAAPEREPVSLDPGPALPGLPVVQVAGAGGTRGPGSRTYDRSGAEVPPPPAPRPPTPPGPVPRIEDSDWLALIDGLTEEDATEGPSRVFIRLPGDAAPGDVASQEQVAKFQATMKELEEGGGTRLAKLIAEGEAPRGASDPQTRPWEDTGKGPPLGAEDPKTQPWEDTGKTPRGAQDPETRPWDDPARRAGDATTTTPQPASGRPESSPRSESTESSGRIVKEFDQQELDPALVCAREATSPRADAFRQLYQRIFHAERPLRGGAGGSDGVRRQARVVLVTSPGPGAGKTTVAANLAVVGARIPGRGAVLVDADPRSRRGGVLRYFGVKRRAEGLLEALSSDGKLEGRTLQFSLGTLDVLPLGLPGSNAPEMIASDRLMGDLLERLRAGYPNSVVVIDGSSALQAADPLVLARLADGVVLVVRAGQTPREDVRRAIDLLGPERILGVVLNDARA